MGSVRIYFPPGKLTQITFLDENGNPRNLDPNSRVIVNSSGARIFAENGNTIAEISWKQGVPFQDKTDNVSEFRIEGGIFFVKNCLQKLVNRSGGKVFGGNNSSYQLHESINERLITLLVHYDEWIPVQLDLGVLDTTFVFNQEGLQIHLGNVLFKRHHELLKPSHEETWNQEVLHSGWGYRKPTKVLDGDSQNTFILVGNSSMVPSVLLSPQPPHPDSLSAAGQEVISRGSSWGTQVKHLNIEPGNCFAEWFQNPLEQEYTKSCIELAELESTPGNDESDRQALLQAFLQNVIFNIMDSGSSYVAPDYEYY